MKIVASKLHSSLSLLLVVGSASPDALDPFGIKEIYPSDPSRALDNWRNRWDRPVSDTLAKAMQRDPHDPTNIMRGTGSVTLGEGVCKFRGRPRLYIQSRQNWEDLEFTAYGMYVTTGSPLSDSGLTLVARTSHGDFEDGCTAPGYYARINLNSGNASFQKEYFHEGSTIVYSDGISASLFQGGLPISQWIGMKFIVYTLPTGKVKLELYIDVEEGENGGNWTLAHEIIDAPGKWLSRGGSSMIPPRCTVQDGDTVLGARKYCFLRTDGDNGTLVVWRAASVRNILSRDVSKSVCPEESIADGDVCCALECGSCGGVGCGMRPGGASACCTGKITNAQERRICDQFPPPCILRMSDESSNSAESSTSVSAIASSLLLLALFS